MRLAIAASTMDSEPLLTKLLDAPLLNIVGISHPDPSIRQNLERQASIPIAPSLTSLRDDVDVQAVVLAPGYSPNYARGEDASISIPSATFLSSGNTRFVFDLLSDTHDTGTKSQVLLPSLYRQPYAVLHESLATERVGSARFLRWTSWWPRPVAVHDLLLNELVAVLSLMGQAPVIAYGVTHSIATDADDYLIATLTFEHGLTAALDIGAALAGGHPFNRVMLVGANGSIHTDSRASSVTHLSKNTASPVDIADPLDAHVDAIEAFTSGATSQNQLALSALRTSDAILNSCASARPVQIPTSGPYT